MKPYILISSCLIGLNTNYASKSQSIQKLVDLVKEGKAIFVCPEQLGGFPTPRIVAEVEPGKTGKDVIEGKGKVMGKDGSDLTEGFLRGAQMTLELCKEMDIKIAILKERSPSCGANKQYDGTFSGNKIAGRGVVAELLSQNGIQVYSEENIPEDL